MNLQVWSNFKNVKLFNIKYIMYKEITEKRLVLTRVVLILDVITGGVKVYEYFNKNAVKSIDVC